MKILKLNILNLCAVIVVATASLLFYRYFHFNHVGEDFLISPVELSRPVPEINENNDLSYVTDRDTSFVFVPDRDNTTALIVGVLKKTYIPTEDNINLNIDATYKDRFDNSIVRRDKFSFPLNTISLGGPHIFSFPRPLVNSKGMRVELKMHLSEHLGDETALIVDNNHYRLIYREVMRGVIERSERHFMQDGRFAYFYMIVFALPLLLLVALLIFDLKNKASKK